MHIANRAEGIGPVAQAGCGGGLCPDAKTLHDVRQAQLSPHCVSSLNPISETQQSPLDAAVSDTRDSSSISVLHGDMSAAEADEM